jgi:hypothetical protein
MVALSLPSDFDDGSDVAHEQPHVVVLDALRLVAQVVAALIDGNDLVLVGQRFHLFAPGVPEIGEAVDQLLTGAISAARGPAAVSRTKRAVHLVLCAILPIMLLALSVFSLSRQTGAPSGQDIARPDIAELAACLDWLEVMDHRGIP